MTIPKKIIELAVEGEWKPWWLGKPVKVSHSFIEVLEKEAVVYQWWQEIALDPLFWQALGNRLMWSEKGALEIFEKNEKVKTIHKRFEVSATPLWKHYAFEFYNLILTNGDTEYFWEELLKDNEK